MTPGNPPLNQQLQNRSLASHFTVLYLFKGKIRCEFVRSSYSYAGLVEGKFGIEQTLGIRVQSFHKLRNIT